MFRPSWDDIRREVFEAASKAALDLPELLHIDLAKSVSSAFLSLPWDTFSVTQGQEALRLAAQIYVDFTKWQEIQKSRISANKAVVRSKGPLSAMDLG